MLQVEYKFKLGEDEYTIHAEVKSQKDFFQAMSFYAGLPKTGPNGETDLKLTYRCVKEFEYYSIVSQEADQEYRFGQYKDQSGLFEKGWEPLFHAERGAQAQEREERPAQSSGVSKFK